MVRTWWLSTPVFAEREPQAGVIIGWLEGFDRLGGVENAAAGRAGT